ncbi:MAG: serine hydrolase [Clostridiaceae bacterium]
MSKLIKDLFLFSLAAVIIFSFTIYYGQQAKSSVKDTEAAALASENTKKQAEKESADFLSLENQVRDYVKDYEDNIGLCYYDLKTGKSIEINTSKEFSAASTVKVPMNMVLLNLAQDGKIEFESSMKFQESDYEGGTGILQNKDLSNPIPLKTLGEYSIVYSDNIATQMIIRIIGRERMYDSFEKMLGREVPRKGNLTTTANASDFLKLLYYNPDNNPYYAGLIENMKNTEFHDRIDKYIPHEITAHKIGNYASYVNDIAIVYTNRPYILAIYTVGLREPEEKIARISEMIYDYQSGLTPGGS